MQIFVENVETEETDHLGSSVNLRLMLDLEPFEFLAELLKKGLVLLVQGVLVLLHLESAPLLQLEQGALVLLAHALVHRQLLPVLLLSVLLVFLVHHGHGAQGGKVVHSTTRSIIQAIAPTGSLLHPMIKELTMTMLQTSPFQ